MLPGVAQALPIALHGVKHRTQQPGECIVWQARHTGVPCLEHSPQLPEDLAREGERVDGAPHSRGNCTARPQPAPCAMQVRRHTTAISRARSASRQVRRDRGAVRRADGAEEAVDADHIFATLDLSRRGLTITTTKISEAELRRLEGGPFGDDE